MAPWISRKLVLLLPVLLSISVFSSVDRVCEPLRASFARGLRYSAKSPNSAMVAAANLAITDGGLLPAQLCGASAPDGGAGFRGAPFTHSNASYRLLITASSVYGEDAPDGARVDFLGLYALDGVSGCKHGSGGHCVLPEELRGVTVLCDVEGLSRPGRFTFPYRERPGGGRTDASTFVLECPLTFGEATKISTSGATTQLLISLEGGAKIDASICAVHVPILHEAVICTEPFFGADSIKFWEGDPLYPRGANLIESFIAHHVDVLGFGHVTINAFSAEFRERVQPFLGARVSYRGGWAMRGASLGRIGFVEVLDYEELAESTCMWEHRLDARWVFRVHAADNFVMSLNGEGIVASLKKLDSSVSGLELPITVPSTDAAVLHPALRTLNVLERWAASRPCPEERYSRGDMGIFCDTWRTVPASNPRHLIHVVVHVNEDGVRTAAFGRNLQGAAVLNFTGLFVSHIMGLTRSDHNKPDIATPNLLLSSYGSKLRTALSIGGAAKSAVNSTKSLFREIS